MTSLSRSILSFNYPRTRLRRELPRPLQVRNTNSIGVVPEKHDSDTELLSQIPAGEDG